MIPYDTLLRDLILIAVWARVLNNAVQGVVQLTTYLMLRRTKSTDPFSIALRQRELALSGKNITAVGFDLLIAIAVTWLSRPEEPDAFDGAWFLYPIVTFTALGAITATLFAIKFLIAYQREDWGMRILEETKVEQAAMKVELAAIEIRHTAVELRQVATTTDQDDRQDRQNEQQTILDETSLINTKRGKYLSEAGVVLDTRRLAMHGDQLDMDHREHDVTRREGEADDRQVTADDRDVTADARDVTACARDVTADDRDVTADARDVTADDRDDRERDTHEGR